MIDPIDRAAALDAIAAIDMEIEAGEGFDYPRWCGYFSDLPSAQSDAIPLEWINKHLEWLNNWDNDFAQLAKVGIRAMVEIWKEEKT